MEKEVVAGLDPGIRAAVKTLWSCGIETFESCEGGEGHVWKWPFVAFHGTEGEALAAFRLLIEEGFPAAVLNHAWRHCPDCYPHLNEEWEIIFLDKSPVPGADDILPGSAEDFRRDPLHDSRAV